MAPASAVTSPSFMTSKGTPPQRVLEREEQPADMVLEVGGRTPRKREATLTSLST